MDGVTAHVGQKVDEATALVAVDGIPVPVRSDLVFYLLYKPAGVVTTASDPQGRPIVLDLVPEAPRVFPAGRLDAETEGLLILTNDGDFAHLLTHPRYGITKTYVAAVEGAPGTGAVRSLTRGVDLEDGPARAIAARVVAGGSGETLVEVVMGEGRKREVRRMLAAIGHPVRRLVRVGIGPLRDRALKPGTWRHLTVEEIRAFYASAGMGR